MGKIQGTQDASAPPVKLQGSNLACDIESLRELINTVYDGKEQIKVPFAFIPKNGSIESLEHLLPAPERIKKAVMLLTPEAMISYGKRFDLGSALAFVSADTKRMMVILDYHTKESASWCDHIAHFVPKPSVALEQWRKVLDRSLALEGFANLLEDRIADISEPTGTDLLALLEGFTVKSSTEVRSIGVLSNGNRGLMFSESQDAVEVPRKLKLYIPLWRDLREANVFVELTVRVRVNQGTALFIISSPKLEEMVEAEFTSLAGKICTELNLFPHAATL